MSTHVPTIESHAHIRWCRCGMVDRHREAGRQPGSDEGWLPAFVSELPGLTEQAAADDRGGR